MAKIPFNTSLGDPYTKDNWVKLSSAINGGLDLDNLSIRIFRGVTNGTANTSQLFRHNVQPTPIGAWVLLGNVYVFSIDNTNVDVRSAQTSIPFIIALIKGRLP